MLHFGGLIRTTLLISLAATLTAACGSAVVDDGGPSSKPAPEPTNPTVIHTADDTFKGSASIQVFIGSAGKPNQYELSIGGTNGTSVWSVIGELDEGALTAGSATITTTPAGIGTDNIGAANLTLQDSPDAVLQSSSGLLTYQLAGGDIQAVVENAVPGSLDATVDGPITFSCLVPQALMPPSAGGQVTPDPGWSTELYVQDEELSTEQCKTARALLP